MTKNISIIADLKVPDNFSKEDFQSFNSKLSKLLSDEGYPEHFLHLTYQNTTKDKSKKEIELTFKVIQPFQTFNEENIKEFALKSEMILNAHCNQRFHLDVDALQKSIQNYKTNG